MMRCVLAVVSLALVSAVPLAAPASSAAECIGWDGHEINQAQTISLLQAGVQRRINATNATHATPACADCHAMAEVFEAFCRERGSAAGSSAAFHSKCIVHTHDGSQSNKAVRECRRFFDFVSDLYCPVDPCTHMTTNNVWSREAICDLMRCRKLPRNKESGRPGLDHLPESCVTYVREIREREFSNLDAETKVDHCDPKFPRFYSREACQAVRSMMIDSVAPLSLSAALTCEPLASHNYAKYCYEVLKLPPTGPVPVAAFQHYLRNHHNENSTDCKEAERSVGMHVVEATYGPGCQNTKNNILQSVQEHCEGRKECTFGNRDLKGKSSAWVPMQDQLSNTQTDSESACSTNFLVRFTCEKRFDKETGSELEKPAKDALVLSQTAGNEGRYRAVPFGCKREGVAL